MPLPSVAVDDVDALAQSLRECGACRIEGLPAAPAMVRLLAELRTLQSGAMLTPAAIGHHGLHAHHPGIRGDSTLWLDDPRCGAASRQMLATLDDLRDALNRRLFQGLTEVEAHYAIYPTGTGYARHRDRFRDNDANSSVASSRILSLVCYLNDDWRAADGGALRLYLDAGEVDVWPLAGSSICFLSELEHEVLPASRERLSIAAWFRRGR
ncbi:MAG: 2OG-Fe(II) oxygenase [Luteimonas sp.]